MKILWVNQIAELLGGTLLATRSMIGALPKPKHHVVCLHGTLDTATRAAFSPHVIEKVTPNAEGVLRVVQRIRPDLIVYQNTQGDAIPPVDEASVVQVYIAHNAGGGPIGAKFTRKLCVSNSLAYQIGWNPDTVLYQPVMVPPNPGVAPPGGEHIVVGKLGTQRPEWWTQAQAEALLGVADDSLQLELVTKILQPADVRVRMVSPGLDATRNLWRWDYLWGMDKKETFGRTIREAQMCGCIPVVHADSGGPVEIVREWGGIIAGNAREAWRQMKARQLDYPLRESIVCTLPWWRNEFIKRNVLWNDAGL